MKLKQYRYSIICHLELFPNFNAQLLMTQDHMKDVLQLTTAIVMASSAKKNIWLQKFKNI